MQDVHVWAMAAWDNNKLLSAPVGEEIVLNELGETTTHGYPIHVFIEDENAFSIKVTDVPKRVCSLTLP